MRTTGRRRLDRVWLGLGTAVIGGVTALGAGASNSESVERLWTGAVLRDDGATTVREVVDYDFGFGQTRHGIFRTIPGLDPATPIQVDSPDAPDGIAAQTSHRFPNGEDGVEVKIGDPNTTITGRHRYLLQYDHPGLQADGRLAWDAVGSGWEVPVDRAEVHVVAPWRFVDPTCDQGSVGATGGCEVDQPEPGHLVVRTTDVEPGQAVTLYADRGEALPTGTPPLPPAPVDPPTDDGVGVARPAAVAAVAAAGAAATMSGHTRRRGRDRVGGGGAADAAFAGTGPSSSHAVDATELDAMATTEFAPPEGLTPAMGGVILREGVTNDHKTAWLLEAAISGGIDLDEDDGKPRLRRTGTGNADQAPILNVLFAGRDELRLGKYDEKFASAWGQIGMQLDRWSGESGLWDPTADRRRTRYRVVGSLVGTLGVLAAAGAGALAALQGAGWLALVAVAAVVAGGCFAAVIRSWELRVRTVQGSAQYLRVESFRRFIAGSEAFHVEEAAKRGLLREYTAWAVAVGEADHWDTVCKAAAIPAGTAGLGYAYLAGSLSSAASSSSTAPSSSGGGGGGAGGGGGGGGGGSW